MALKKKRRGYDIERREDGQEEETISDQREKESGMLIRKDRETTYHLSTNDVSRSKTGRDLDFIFLGCSNVLYSIILKSRIRIQSIQWDFVGQVILITAKGKIRVIRTNEQE